MQEHPTKLVQYNRLEAHVDVEIADLILNLWKLDLMTFNSCQDNVPKGFVWIEFASAWDAEQFLNYVSQYSEETRIRLLPNHQGVGGRYRPRLAVCSMP